MTAFKRQAVIMEPESEAVLQEPGEKLVLQEEK